MIAQGGMLESGTQEASALEHEHRNAPRKRSEPTQGIAALPPQAIGSLCFIPCRKAPDSGRRRRTIAVSAMPRTRAIAPRSMRATARSPRPLELRRDDLTEVLRRHRWDVGPIAVLHRLAILG